MIIAHPDAYFLTPGYFNTFTKGKYIEIQPLY